MKRLLLLPLLALAACSPDAPPAASAPAQPAAPALPASMGTAPAPSAGAVPFSKLGWADNKYTWEGKPFTGTTEDTFKKTGKLRLRYQLKDGAYHGLVEEWYENGNKLTHTLYENAQHQGDNIYWNTDGTLQAHKVWKDNVKISETHGEKRPSP